MPYKKEIEELRLKLVQSYVEALNTLSVEPVIESFHDNFKYMLYGSFGIGTGLRYLGFLLTCFHQMKKEGKTLKAELIWIEDGSYKFPAVKLHQPIDIRIFYQAEWYNCYKWKFTDLGTDMILYVRMKENRIFRIICDNQGAFDATKWIEELKRHTETHIIVDTYDNRI